MTRKLFALGILIAATLACTTKPADVKLSCPQGPSHALYNPGATKLNPWSITHNPAAAAQATITRAAGAATVKHVLTDLQACFSAGATAGTPVNVYVRDGATGAGTVLWSGVLAVAADTANCLSVSFSQPIIGTAATAMTLEFDAAGAATTVETVSGQGYDL